MLSPTRRSLSVPLAALAALAALVGTAVVLAAPAAHAGDAGPTPTISGTFQACVNGTECASGHCVEGVCCDTACTDRCHSCALPSAPGHCTAVPAGTDPRQECGPTNSCNGTCDATGACSAASAGTSCHSPQCNGSVLSAASTCASAGGACASSGATWDCAPYACSSTFGACLTSCSGDADCVSGNSCDLATKVCAPASAHCSADRKSAIAKDGTSVSCEPYLCSTSGLCRQSCVADADCATPATCDVAGGRCAVPQPAGNVGSGGGCDVGGSTKSASGARFELGALVTLGGLLALVLRAGRARRDARRGR